jgi:hypothetical protein
MSTSSGRHRDSPRDAAPLSGRARTTLLQHQRRLTELQRDVAAADRLLAGALSAGTGATQVEMLETYLESIQELRVCAQRLEAFLISRVLAERD